MMNPRELSALVAQAVIDGLSEAAALASLEANPACAAAAPGQIRQILKWYYNPTYRGPGYSE
jgi:hypothetical protein